MGPPGPVCVVVVSRHALIRAGLTQLLADDHGGPVVVEACAPPVPPGQHADVALFDLAALGEGEEQLLAGLLGAGVAVIALEAAYRPDLAEAALVLGVADLVPMDVTGPQLRDAVARVAAGRRIRADQRRARIHEELQAETGLTARELEVVELIAHGLSNLEIADRLCLSINSVKTYIRTAYRTLGVKSRSQAILWATHHGLSLGEPRLESRTPPPDGDRVTRKAGCE